MIERFETRDIPTAHRLRGLASFTSDTFASVDVSSVQVGALEARSGRVRIGRIGMAWMRIDGSGSFEVDGGAIGEWSRAEHDTLLLSVQESGCCEGYYPGATFTARIRDMVLTDPAQLPRWRATWSGRMSSLTLKLPAELVLSKVPHADALCGRRLGAEIPRVALASSLLISIKQAIEDEAIQEWDEDYEDILIGIVASALGACRGLRDDTEEKRLIRRARVAVEQRLGDPDLTTASLAGTLGIAVRTLHRIFANAGTTPGGYVLQRRIATAADRLRRDPGANVTDISMSLGFNDPSHFARAFRQRFGVSPTGYRRIAHSSMASALRPSGPSIL